MKHAPVYTQFEPSMLEDIFGILNTIKNETRPIEGHQDPLAIQDCWNTVNEKLILIVEKVRSSILVEKRLDNCIAASESTLEKITPFTTAYNLEKGRLNGYNFVKTFFAQTENNKTYNNGKKIHTPREV